MASVGMVLRVIARIEAGALGTSQTRQLGRTNWRLGAFLKTASGNVGNARRPLRMTAASVS
jgi:hypothetical protein